MKTRLIFFDSFENSKDGFIRGFIVFISLIFFYLIWFKIVDYSSVINRKKINIYSAIIIWVLLSSALAVQIPSNYKEALTYSALVGLSIFGVFNTVNYTINKNWPIKIAILDTLWGIINCSIAGSILWVLYWKKRNLHS